MLIQLVQANQGKLSSGYLPYTAGLLQAYVLRHMQAGADFRFAPLLHERPFLDNALQQVLPADVFAFSTYVWNMQYSLALAKQIKSSKPSALIIFGGPQVPDRAEEFLRTHPFIDVCVHGEGERVFLKLLESLPGRNWETIPGISWNDRMGVFHHHAPGERISELDEIPSPYLMGLFDEILADTSCNWIAQWETNRGCPFSCSFCDWGSNIASKVRRFGLERLQAEIDWFAARKFKVINCCDANFGLLPRDVELTDALIEARRRTGYPLSITIQNAKNVTERAYTIQRRLIQAGLSNLVTLSLQSLSPQTLKSIQRENISLETYRQLQKRFSADGVRTYTDLLVGLPGETYESFTDGVSRTISEGQHHWIQFYNVYVLPNAELAQPAYRAKHGLETVRLPYHEPFFPIWQEVDEIQEMVIATATLSRADWRRIRAFAWWVRILYFMQKLLQLPLLVLHHQTGAPLRELFAFFSEGRFRDCPLLTDLKEFLERKALSQQRGEAEHCVLDSRQGSHWVYVEDYFLVGLADEQRARDFFAEAHRALNQWLEQSGHVLPAGLLSEAIGLSQALYLTHSIARTFEMKVRYNLWEYYQSLVRGEAIALIEQPGLYVHDWYGEPAYDLKVEQPKINHHPAV